MKFWSLACGTSTIVGVRRLKVKTSMNKTGLSYLVSAAPDLN